MEIVDRIISNALDEDCGIGDLTTECIVPLDLIAQGEFLAKEDLVLAGWPVAVRVFQKICPAISAETAFVEGDLVQSGRVFGRVRGPVAKLLTGERVALNFLQRLSGIATQTRNYVNAVSGTKAVILDTRKTTPGLRILEKYAVRMGGGKNHRFGLYDGVLIKENHIIAGGGVREAIRRARDRMDHLKRIEIEVTNLEELNQALGAEADIILLDNMTVPQVKEAIDQVCGRALLEVSGGIRLENVRQYALTGIDFISVGALTHSSKAVDISLEISL
ncbi:MAG: carboxylating nicotinate-nucleotide diphosphorylase [Acidobacteria bacterium]|nr:MAG: carboxylating nicotinate-nucleotide diphosphorylase [Acidobacteriota bacterium]